MAHKRKARRPAQKKEAVRSSPVRWELVAAAVLVVLTVALTAGYLGTTGKTGTEHGTPNGVNPVNHAPIPKASASATSVLTFEDVTLDASQSKDPDGWIENFTWIIEDYHGKEYFRVYGREVSVSFNHSGVYFIDLIVRDDKGRTARLAADNPYARLSIEVLNRLPVVPDLRNRTAEVGEPVQFNASSAYDPDGTIQVVEWDFGDGTQGEGFIVEHTYTEPGTYTVTLRLTDDSGGSVEATVKVVVLE